jgi:hypothetical protein
MICTPHQLLLNNQRKENKLSGHVPCMGKREMHEVLVGKQQGTAPTGRPMHE